VDVTVVVVVVVSHDKNVFAGRRAAAGAAAIMPVRRRLDHMIPNEFQKSDVMRDALST
jgi:hypothetical protein